MIVAQRLSPVGQGKAGLYFRRSLERLGGVFEAKIMQIFDAPKEVFLGCC